MNKNVTLFIVCVIFNLIIGNWVLLAFLADTSIIYRFLISLGTTAIYAFAFLTTNKQKYKPTKIKIVFTAVVTGFASMLVACIFTSIAIRLPSDNMITAGLKGIIPTFIFSLIFASLVWILIVVGNFLCFNNMKYTSDKE
ncbi:hypothetical protein [Chryseobacterium sp. ERMR1:04]|uniref:hypothetical protein n=1 Tax=Chryseobacterium sp. ERMR1:04 TaxID=1705393 RepID=UPI0006C887A1|nr:hypothetical protein [Chryseobacterium sp. ERMR1:04]KPH14727.1 hypothetical protein AMQ68_04565 [Chryseobacterium sp. ERMR1:04]